MGFYDSFKEISASKNAAAQNAQQAAATMAELRLKGAENLNKNLQGIGNAIMDYAKVRYTMDKDARDEAFRQSQLDETARQFNTRLEQEAKHFNDKLAWEQKQYNDTGAAYVKSQTKKNNASAWKTSAETQKINAVNKLENAVEAAQKDKSETKTTPQNPQADKNFNKVLNTKIADDTSLTAGQGNPPSTQKATGLLGKFQKTAQKFKDGKLIAQDDKNAPLILPLT